MIVQSCYFTWKANNKYAFIRVSRILAPPMMDFRILVVALFLILLPSADMFQLTMSDSVGITAGSRFKPLSTSTQLSANTSRGPTRRVLWSRLGNQTTSTQLSANTDGGPSRRTLIIGASSALGFKLATGAVVYKAVTNKPYASFDDLLSSESFPALESSAQTEAANLVSTLPPVAPILLPPKVNPTDTRLVIVRHGQTYMNRLHVCRGQRIDDSLDPVGKFQAQRTATALSKIQFDANGFYSSNLARSKETLNVLSASLGPPQSSPLLNEVDYGELEGLQNLKPICSAPFGEHFNGESIAAVNNRVDDALNFLISNNRGKTVLAVSHGAFITALLHKIAPDRSLTDFLFLSNCSVNVIDVSKDGKATIKLVNECSHLKP